MRWKQLKNPIKSLVVLGIIGLSLWLVLPIQSKIRLGLDLQGGSSLLLQLYPTAEVPQITPQIQEQTKEVIDRRINGLGVLEPTITKVGGNRILVELPAVKNSTEAENVLKQVAVLEYKIVPPEIVPKAEAALAACNANPKDVKACDFVNIGAYNASGKVVYQGKDLKGAQPGYSQNNEPDILFQTKDPAKFGKLTTANLGKPLGIFLDKRYVSAPTINGAIFGSGEITGQFTQQQAIELANELNAGALPVTVKIIEKDTIGPTLGKLDLLASLKASMLGLALVLIFMIAMYRFPGLLADLALVIYVLMMLGLLALSKASLTLPGIAGFVLSIGMAVDANVLIFERIKEELWAGKSMRLAVKVGFERAFSAVWDSHFTTIVGAFVLFSLGTGTVKGFAFTLVWGTIFSLVTAVFITRFFVDLFVDSGRFISPELYGVKSSDVGIFSKVEG